MLKLALVLKLFLELALALEQGTELQEERSFHVPLQTQSSAWGLPEKPHPGRKPQRDGSPSAVHPLGALSPALLLAPHQPVGLVPVGPSTDPSPHSHRLPIPDFSPSDLASVGSASRTAVQWSTVGSGLGGTGGLPRTGDSGVREECVSSCLLPSSSVACQGRDGECARGLRALPGHTLHPPAQCPGFSQIPRRPVRAQPRTWVSDPSLQGLRINPGQKAVYPTTDPT